MSQPTTLKLDRAAILKNVFLLMVSVEFLLFTLDYHLNYAQGAPSAALQRLFSTSREDGLAGWVAIIQTALIAATVWLIYVVVRGSVSRWQRYGWLTLALFFSYLTLDDGAHIHERLGTAYHEGASAIAFGAWTLDVFPSYRWQIVLMPVFAAMGFFMFGFLLRQLNGWKPKVAVFAALSLLATAVMMDFFEGLAPDHRWNPYTAIADSFHLEYWTARTFNQTPYATLLHFSKSVEETLEMFAMTSLWLVFLSHLMSVANGVRIVAPETPTPTRAARPRTASARALGRVLGRAATPAMASARNTATSRRAA